MAGRGRRRFEGIEEVRTLVTSNAQAIPVVSADPTRELPRTALRGRDESMQSVDARRLRGEGARRRTLGRAVILGDVRRARPGASRSLPARSGSPGQVRSPLTGRLAGHSLQAAGASLVLQDLSALAIGLAIALAPALF